MMRYGSTYRSPFNGPRWGALLAMIVILFGQAVSAFHDPSLVSDYPMHDGHCDGAVCSAEAGEASAPSDPQGSSTGVHCGQPIHADGDCAQAICCSGCAPDDAGNWSGDVRVPADGDCEDCSDCGDCAQDCTNCCYHVPMSSPLPALHASLQHGTFSLALPAHPFILAADITPPFHPPRG